MSASILESFPSVTVSHAHGLTEPSSCELFSVWLKVICADLSSAPIPIYRPGEERIAERKIALALIPMDRRRLSPEQWRHPCRGTD